MKKFIIGVVGFSVFILAGGIYLFAKTPSRANLEKEAGAKIGIDHREFSFGTVRLSSGIVVHRYPIKNIGTKDLKIANLASSCACTKVYFKSSTQESPRASMKGMTRITDWVGILKPGESAEIIMEFDPNFHGPTGVGKITRSLSFETNDPQTPYAEFSLTGEVVK